VNWRTREEVFADAEVLPLLERDQDGILEATPIIEELRRAHGQRFTDKHLRTRQRRVRDTRAMHGAEREVKRRSTSRTASRSVCGLLVRRSSICYFRSWSRSVAGGSVTLAFSLTFEAFVCGCRAPWQRA